MVGALLAYLAPVLAFADDGSTEAAADTIEEGITGPAEWLEQIFETITNSEPLSLVLTAVVALLFTAVLAHLATKLIHILMEREVLHVANTSLIVNISRVVIWAIGIAVVLSTCFGIDVTGWITALGVGGIALSLGLQDTISNLFGGLQVSVLGIVNPGDYVEVGGCRGIVQDVSWRQTTIRDFTGTVYIIPNKNMNTSTVTILPPSRKIKVEVDFNNNLGRDLEELKRYMLIAVKNEVSKVAAVDRDPIYRFSAITEYCFEGAVIIWVNTQPAFDIYEVQDAIVRACAPYARASQITKELQVRSKTKGALQKAEGYEELVSADANMADEYLSEEDFIRKVPGKDGDAAKAAAAASVEGHAREENATAEEVTPAAE